MGVGLSPLFRRFAPFRAADRTGHRALSWKRLFSSLADISGNLRSERDRWPLWLPVALGCGIGVYFALPFEPTDSTAIVVAAAGVAAIIAAPSTAMLRACLIFAAVAAIGFSAARLRTDIVAAPVIAHRMPPTGIDGRIEAVEMRGKGKRIMLRVARIDRLSAPPPKYARISVRSGTDILEPGRWVHLKAVLMPPPEPAAPGDFDFGRAAYFMRLGGVGYAYGKPVPIAPLGRPDVFERIRFAVDGLRWRMTARIHAVLPGSTGSIAAALITGDRGGISDEDETALRDAGLAHVLAIAGLHMALVGLGIFWAVRAFLALFPTIALTQPIKKWAALAALASATFYLVISGAAVPTERAFVMLAMMLIAILVDRPALSMRSVAMAASLILLARPESLIEPGFQMSFAAVVALIAVVEWEQARPRGTIEAAPLWWRKLRHYFGGIAMTSFVGSLATLPFAVFHFDRATHYAVLGNLLAMPVMGLLVMPAAAVSVLLMPFGLDSAPLHVMGYGIEAMLAVGRWVSHLPGSVSVVAAWPVHALVMISLGGLWIALWRRRWRWLGLLPLAAGVVAAFAPRPPDLLVARDGATVALRGSDGVLHLMGAPKDRYSASEWLKRTGDARQIAEAVATPAAGVRCDEFGCIGQAGGMLVAAVRREDALAEDCARASIVVSAIPVRRRCNGTRLAIDRFDVARNGAYAVWFSPFRIATAQGARGDRPWSERPRRHERRFQ